MSNGLPKVDIFYYDIYTNLLSNLGIYYEELKYGF